jgi:hypothetical protein
MRAKFLIVALLPLAACAQAFESRVASRLTEAGLSRPTADCMAKRWVERLNVAQLQKISSLSEDIGKDRSAGRLTIGRFLDRVREVNDPEIFSVVSGSSVACALTS